MLPVQQKTLNSMYRAEVAELADARGSGPRTRKGVGVRVPSSAPKIQRDSPESGKYKDVEDLDHGLSRPCACGDIRARLFIGSF